MHHDSAHDFANNVSKSKKSVAFMKSGPGTQDFSYVNYDELLKVSRELFLFLIKNKCLKVVRRFIGKCFTLLYNHASPICVKKLILISVLMLEIIVLASLLFFVYFCLIDFITVFI